MDDALGETMRTRALIQGQAAKEILGEMLWTKVESLATLDDLLDRHMPSQLRDPEAIADVVGAFLGESVRKATGAAWEREGDGEPYLSLPDGRRLHPLARARRRLSEGRRASLAAYGEACVAYARDPAAPDPAEAMTAARPRWPFGGRK